ncbi:MAG: SDR family oxidoreductase [Nitrospirota bacterium]
MRHEVEKNHLTISDNLRTEISSAIQFSITENMVSRFSELTSDSNPLHTQQGFARRSIYRQQVVHGMLPLGFISLLNFFQQDNFISSIVEMSAQFNEPVFISNKIILSAIVAGIDKENNHARFNFTLENAESKSIITKGAITAIYHPLTEGDNFVSQKGAFSNHSMVQESFSAKDLRLEEISKNDKDGFNFMVTEESIKGLLEILYAGISGGGKFDSINLPLRFYFPNLLSIMLFSTSVGMGIPGRYATFLEFTAKVNKDIKINTPYLLKGEVTHISQSTRIIKKNISVSNINDGEDSPVSGKVNILVNQPPSKMPSIQTLKENNIDMNIKGKVVLITGASRGIGETTAKLFGLLGAKVIVNYFQGEGDAKRVADEIVSAGGDAFALQADVSNPIQVQEMVKRAVEKYHTINILVNNAAKDFRPVNFLKLSWNDVQRDIDVVVKGAFNCCKEIIPLMVEHGGGKIINISTVATENPPPNQVKYVVSKSAIVGLTRALSVEFAAKNIQVNMVVPNFVETDLVSHIPEAYRKKIAQDTPMQRNASPVDVAQAIVFLASSYSSFTTGQKIMVTGGGLPYL